MARPDENLIRFYKEKYQHLTLKQSAREFKRLQAKYEKEKAKSAETYHQFEYLRRTTIPKIMDDLGLTTAKVDGIGRVQIGFQTSAKQLDKEALVEWLKKNKHKEIITTSINASTLASFMTAQVANGDPIPDKSIVDYKASEVASVVKG